MQSFEPSVEDVWSILLTRITDPRPFLPGLASAQLVSDDGVTITRRLDFGSATITDQVTRSTEPGWIRFSVAPSSLHAGGSLQIDVHSRKGLVSLTFTYQTSLTDGQETSGGVEPAEYVKSAYRQSDLDTVRIIRERLGSDAR